MEAGPTGQARMMTPNGDSRMGALPPWARWSGGQLLLALHVQPGARRSGVVGAHGERLKIALQAPPVDGKANEALLRFVAQQLGCRRDAVTLAAGAASREKRVQVACAQGDAAACVARLRPGDGR
jgi:uncharacterized protein (TIGR00251 family)